MSKSVVKKVNFKNFWSKGVCSVEFVGDEKDSVTKPGRSVDIGKVLRSGLKPEDIRDNKGFYESILGVSLPNIERMGKAERLQYERDFRLKVGKKRGELQLKFEAEQARLKAIEESGKGTGDEG